jgi:hypothetical protein
VFSRLSPAEIEARLHAASSKLAELDAYEEIACVPIRLLTDQQLADRMTEIEQELSSPAVNDSDPAQLSPIERRAILRHLEVIEYLIEHPNASIPPARQQPLD